MRSWRFRRRGRPADGAVIVELAAQQGIEGVVAKRLRSRYRPGDRSPDCVKQPLRRVATAIVCGWLGTCTRVEALLLAAPHPDGGMRYLGHVGPGFTATARRELLAQLVELEAPHHLLDATPPPSTADARWVRPELVGEIHYRRVARMNHLVRGGDIECIT